MCALSLSNVRRYEENSLLPWLIFGLSRFSAPYLGQVCPSGTTLSGMGMGRATCGRTFRNPISYDTFCLDYVHCTVRTHQSDCALVLVQPSPVLNLPSSHGWDRAGQTGVRAHIGRKNRCMVMSEGVHMRLSFTGGHNLMTHTDSEYIELGWICNTVLPQADRHNSAVFPRMTRSPRARSKRLRAVHRWVAACSVSLLPAATALPSAAGRCELPAVAPDLCECPSRRL